MVERMAALVALGAVLIAGCDLRPRPFRSVFGEDGCKYKEATYSHGSTTCQSGTQYRCDDGQWKGWGTACAENLPVAGKGCDLNGNSELRVRLILGNLPWDDSISERDDKLQRHLPRAQAVNPRETTRVAPRA